MVDSVNNSGQTANVKAVQIKSAVQTEEKKKQSQVERQDEVVISEQAQSLRQIEKEAEDAGKKIAENQSATLSSDIKKLSTLV